ncbi:MAG TPA: hypothetical protein VGO93_11975 [Candidatus Xenobia bacterium]
MVVLLRLSNQGGYRNGASGHAGPDRTRGAPGAPFPGVGFALQFAVEEAVTGVVDGLGRIDYGSSLP